MPTEEKTSKTPLDLIPADAPRDTVSFDFGQEIASADTDAMSNVIGIIVEGEAELYESSWFDDRACAYRPIRLMKKDDIFGDFSFLDTRIGPSSSLRPLGMVGTPGETWKLVAGRQCMLLLDRLHPINYPKERNGKDQWELCDSYVSNEKTKITFVNLQKLRRDSSFYRYLLETAWQRAQTYRLCVNSYNYHSLLSFRLNFSRRVMEYAADHKYKKMASEAQHMEFRAAFADALFDAINRPRRREPVFSKRDLTLSGSSKVNLQEYGINPSSILMATDDYSRDFFFPLDLSNYFINVHSRACMEERQTEGAQRQERDRILKLFGRQEKDSGPERRKRERLTPALQFYQAVVTSLLNSPDLCREGDLYTVTCTNEPGPLSQRLLLHFTPKVLEQ